MASERPYPHELCRWFLLDGLTDGRSVLDVGCGTGELMWELVRRGVAVAGVEIDARAAEQCRAHGLSVITGRAEQLPYPDASFDAVVCSVVLPYVDELRTIAEWARVLKPGGLVAMTGHGIGYAVDYLLNGTDWRRRLYGVRMAANTLALEITGRKWRGRFGDTVCQTRRRLRRDLRRAGFQILEERVIGHVVGLPRFIACRARLSDQMKSSLVDSAKSTHSEQSSSNQSMKSENR